MSSPDDEGNNNASASASASSPTIPPRLSPEERLQQYKSGSILRIKLKNFLTYADVEFKPGPRLNVVCGPNGTGKSTILCAICLGLGGQPPLLGRADDARTFIKNDEMVAEIEIELAPPSNNNNNSSNNNNSKKSNQHHIIKRIIDRNKGAERGRGVAASTYFLNNQPTNLKAIQHLVSHTYRIAIDNLCTFLPQDRVGSFSGFDSKMLLQETEKSVSGTQFLYNSHMELIALEKEILESDSNLDTIRDKAESLQKEVDKLEREKELMEEREQHMNTMMLLKQKHAWVLFDTKRDVAIKLKDQKKECKTHLTKAREEVLPLEQHLATIDEDLNRNKQRKSTLNRASMNAHQHFEGGMKRAERYLDTIEDNKVALTEIDSNHRRKLLRIEDCRSRLEQNEAVLNDFPPEEELVTAYRAAHEEQKAIREQMKGVKAELARHQQAFRDKQEDLRTVSYKFDKMKDEKVIRNEKIFNSDKSLREAYAWVDQNRKMFRRQVWGPIVCEITTQDLATSNCLEQHVRNAVLKSFVVECQEDYNLLYREVRQKNRIPVNIQVVMNGKLEGVNRRYSASKMETLRREHGVQGYLDECFTAPDPIVQALRNTSNVQSVLIGNDQTTDSLNRNNLMNYLNQRENGQGLQASCIFANDRNKTFKYTSIISRYSGKASLNLDEISPARMLKPGVSPEYKAQVEDQLNNLKREADEIQPMMAEAEQRYESFQSAGQLAHGKMKDAQKGKQELQEANNKVVVAKRKLRDAERDSSTDCNEEKRNIRIELTQNVNKYLSSLKAAGAKYDEFLATSCEIAGIDMTEEGKRQKCIYLGDKIREMKIQTEDLEHQFKMISAAFQKEKQKLGHLKQRAIEIAPISDQNGNDLPLKEKLNTLPDNLTELEESMEDTKEQIEGIHDNPDVMRRYEEQKRELHEIKDYLENLNESKGRKEKDLVDKKIPWEASLKNIVKKVNVLFEGYMKELGCAGEVRLAEGDQPTRGRGNSSDGAGEEKHLGNFKEWGVEIRVKFREKSELQVLSAQVHSGGERSVSTIMYLMAMQNMMVSPFRCVDEINQGLDERNERLVFRRIVQNSTQPPENEHDPSSHCGQYFLITPKLLPNLTDMENEDVTVHCIFNGPFNFKHFGDWDVDAFVGSKRRMSTCHEGGDTSDLNARRKRLKADV